MFKLVVEARAVRERGDEVLAVVRRERVVLELESVAGAEARAKKARPGDVGDGKHD